MDRPPFTSEQLEWLRANLPPGPFNRTLGDAEPSEPPVPDEPTPT